MANPYRSECGSVVSNSDEGGYLVPSVVSIDRRGALGFIARLFNHPYGWEDYRLADEIVKAANAGKPIVHEQGMTLEEFKILLLKSSSRVNGI